VRPPLRAAGRKRAAVRKTYEVSSNTAPLCGVGHRERANTQVNALMLEVKEIT